MEGNEGSERRSRPSSPFGPDVALLTEGTSPVEGPHRLRTRASQYGFDALQLGRSISRAATLLESSVSSATDLTKATENLKKILSLQKILLHAPSTEARLLERRGQMHEVDKVLLMQQKYYAKEEEQFRLKESQLREKEAQLHVQLERFNKFIDTNAEKKRRAEDRAAADRVAIHEEEKKIAALKLQLKQKEADCGKLEARARKYKIFEEFLAAAVREGEDFQEIADLMTRYELLRSIHANLVKKEEELNEKSDQVRNALLAYKKHAANEILEKNNTIAALQRELEACEKEKISKEGQADEFLSHTTDEALYFGQLLLSIQNLFQRCSEKRPNIQHSSGLARLLPSQQQSTPADQTFGIPSTGPESGNSQHVENTSREEHPTGERTANKVSSDLEDGNRPSALGSSDTVGRDAARCPAEKGESVRKEENSPARTPRSAAVAAAAPTDVHTSSANVSKATEGDQESSRPPLSSTAAGGTSSAPAEVDVPRSRRDSSGPAIRVGSDSTARGSAANAGEKTKKPEPPVDQGTACSDAIQMLEVVQRYLKDFKDICETLTKNRRQQLKGGKFVNLNVNYAQEDDVIEFVKVYDSRGQKNLMPGGGETTKDLLSTTSSKKFLPRMRTQALRQNTAQTPQPPFSVAAGMSVKNFT